MKRPSHDQSSTAAGVAKLLVASVVAGGVVAAMALPAVGVSGVSARNAMNDFWNSPIEELDASAIGEKIRLLDTDGKEFAELYEVNRESVNLDDVSKHMQNAVIAIEDHRFFEHGAMDLQGLLRALVRNAEAGGAREGASTLTQQYVKQVRVYSQPDRKSQEKVLLQRDLQSKLLELKYAVNVEKDNTKHEILEKYLNVANFGDASYGVQAAAQRYFGKPAKKLNLNESAMLAGMVKDPTGYDPTQEGGDSKEEVAARREKLKNRRNIVLDRMVRYGYAKKDKAEKAMKADLPLNVQARQGSCVNSRYPYFCEYVRYEILRNPLFGKNKKAREKAYKKGGLTIKTTLDSRMQKAAERALRRKVSPKNNKVASEALIVPGTGFIRAMAASKKFGLKKKKGQINYNIVADVQHGGGAGFQIGSTAKAFTLATGLKEGKRFNDGYALSGSFTPASGFKNCQGQSVNDSSHKIKGTKGSFNILRGTANSVNDFFMNLERDVGLCDVVKTAKALGLQGANGARKDLTKSKRDVVPTFTLGVTESNPVTMAAAFATFAAKGKYCKPLPFTEVTDVNGNATKVEPSCKQALDEDVAVATAHVMQGVWNGTMGRASRPNRPAAGKTGTTDLGSSLNFGGYTPDIAGFVNMGDYRGAFKYPLGHSLFGASIPGPVFVSTINSALKGTPKTSFPKPASKFRGGHTPKPKKDKDKCKDKPFLICPPGDDDDGPGRGRRPDVPLPWPRD